MDTYAWITATVAGLALLLLAGCDLQYRMLYQPSPDIPAAHSIAGSGIRFWPAYGAEYRGFVGGNESGGARGTFVVFHGNGGIAADRLYYVKALGALGYRVVLAEYPRYGGRGGELGQAAFVRDAGETLIMAYESFGGPIFLLGESLGCGIVAALVRETPLPVRGVVLITPWDTLWAVARTHFPYLPVRLFLKDSYDNAANLARFRGRIAIVGAVGDEIIPISHARTLYRTLASPAVKIWEIQGAGHNDWPDLVGPEWWRDVAAFVGKPP